MIVRRPYIISLILLLSIGAFAQQSSVTPAFWRLTGISGEIRMEGLYRNLIVDRPLLKDTATITMLSGGINLNASSFFWHPDFLLVDVGIEYSPLRSRSTYAVIPDQGELRTLQKLNVRGTLFQKKIVSLSAFANVSETFSNREFLSDIRTNAKTVGGIFFLRSKALPLSVSYQKGNIEQEELKTGRMFSYETSTLEGRINKSFGRRDKHELVYTRNEFKRLERELPGIQNDLDELMLTNEIYLDKKKKIRFFSLLQAASQQGYDTLERKQAHESLSWKLPWKFELIGNYNYYDVSREVQNINQQTSRGMLRHKLFESLNSQVFYENTMVTQTVFDQKETRKGLDLMYEKKIPAGVLSLSYRYLDQHQEQTGDPTSLTVKHEAYVLTDGNIVLLQRPHVDVISIMVWDASGVILYQLNFDYLVIQRGDYLEIQRVPGGQIPNNATVYVDYLALISGSYQYDMKSEFWSAGVTLFKQFLGLYYRNFKQDYYNLEQTDAVTLNYITQQVYGIRLEYKTLSGGVEFDDNNSSILPYELTRYFLTLQGQLNQKLRYSVNGNMSEYHLVRENIDQKYTDISGQLAYQLTARSRLNLEAGYRHQEGQGIDLDLINSRLEYSTSLQKLYFTLGVQTFQRTYLEEIDRYNGAYFRIARRF